MSRGPTDSVGANAPDVVRWQSGDGLLEVPNDGHQRPTTVAHGHEEVAILESMRGLWLVYANPSS
jgi:hypothetical protein